jgi:glucuronate isomerase
MSNFFNRLNNEDQLTNTIVYNLNPSMNKVFASMIGNFSSSKVSMQFGTAWWYLDQKDGIEEHISTLSNLGLLSKFIGMLTDSRSFLSFPRHEYFRRILCNIIGKDIDEGLLPSDINFFGKIVQNICYYNAKNFFKL